MRLLTSYFHDKERKKEFDFCLERNMENDYIDEILLFYESGELPKLNDKVKILHYDRPTYRDFFEQFEEGEVNVVANTDIFFDESAILMNRVKDHQCYCITRHEYDPEQLLPFSSKPQWSQDVWVMRKKPSKLEAYEYVVAINNLNRKYETIPFYLGVAGCDNHVAYLLSKNFMLINPYFDINCIHVHKNEERDYSMKYRITGQMGSRYGILKHVKPSRI